MGKMDDIKRIGIITSGGDCGGLNAVIKGSALAGHRHGIRSFVIPKGYAGLYNLVQLDHLVELTPKRLIDIQATVAGSDAGHSRVKLESLKDTEKYNRIRRGLARFGIDALVISGGDDTGSVVLDLANHGLRCVHAPKTMDLDLQTYSVGADSTIGRIAAFARDLKTTGRTHNRILVLEVFGRYAGHTALWGGIAAEADAILIPEIEVDFDILYSHMKEHFFSAIQLSDMHAGTYLIVVAEGLSDASGSRIVDEGAGLDAFGHRRLGGAGQYVKEQLDARLKNDPDVQTLMTRFAMYVEDVYERPEIRTIVPSHLVRCGETSAYDVVFGLKAGAAAVELLVRGIYGVTVADICGNEIRYMRTDKAIQQRFIDVDDVALYERLGVCFGRAPGAEYLRVLELAAPPERRFQ